MRGWSQNYIVEPFLYLTEAARCSQKSTKTRPPNFDSLTLWTFWSVLLVCGKGGLKKQPWTRTLSACLSLIFWRATEMLQLFAYVKQRIGEDHSKSKWKVPIFGFSVLPWIGKLKLQIEVCQTTNPIRPHNWTRRIEYVKDWLYDWVISGQHVLSSKLPNPWLPRWGEML